MLMECSVATSTKSCVTLAQRYPHSTVYICVCRLSPTVTDDNSMCAAQQTTDDVWPACHCIHHACLAACLGMGCFAGVQALLDNMLSMFGSTGLLVRMHWLPRIEDLLLAECTQVLLGKGVACCSMCVWCGTDSGVCGASLIQRCH